MFTTKNVDWLPPFKFPTKTIFIDDDESLLNIFPKEVSRLIPHFNFLTFSSALEAVEFIERYENMPYLSLVLSEKFKTDFDQPPSEFSINKDMVFRQLYKSDRFNEISVAIVDYSMPEMEGITFCKYLNKNTKRIILTGLGDQAVAIKAFNTGLISQYIDKGVDDVSNKIAQLIMQYQSNYFREPCQTIHKYLGKTHFLNEKNILVSFKQLVEQHDIVEFYLIRPTQLLCIDYNGKHFLFIAENYNSLANQYQIATERDAPNCLLDLLSNATHIPYFVTDDGYFDESLLDWENQFHEKYSIVGNEKHFCAFIEEPEIPGLISDKIISYKDYLDNNFKRK